MTSEAIELEKSANDLSSQGEYVEAFRLYRESALRYQRSGNHSQAALCFALAAGCWSLYAGEKRYFQASTAYEEAARETIQCGDWAYASVLYGYAALAHEKDGESSRNSECVYLSKECMRRYLSLRLFSPSQAHISVIERAPEVSRKGWAATFVQWLEMTLSYLVWGYGERPFRTFFSGIVIIVLSAFLYALGKVQYQGAAMDPSFFQALYMSAVTFTTVGYGDFTPLGAGKIIAMCESLSGVTLIPMYVVALTRRYLRI